LYALCATNTLAVETSTTQKKHDDFKPGKNTQLRVVDDGARAYVLDQEGSAHRIPFIAANQTAYVEAMQTGMAADIKKRAKPEWFATPDKEAYEAAVQAVAAGHEPWPIPFMHKVPIDEKAAKEVLRQVVDALSAPNKLLSAQQLREET